MLKKTIYFSGSCFMCIRLRWDENHLNVIHQVFEEGWTLQAYYHSIAALEAMTINRPNPVTLIMNMTTSTTPPMHHTHSHTVEETQAMANIEQVIIVNPGKFMPLVDRPVHIVTTPDEAYQLLEIDYIAKPA
jgi:hypothetical protein